MLKEIQSLENQLINSPNCGSSSLLFTAMMHKTSEWIDKDAQQKEINVSPYKKELDKTVELICYYIECGYITDEAMAMASVNRHTIQAKFTDTHNMMLRAARNQRTINKNKNK